MANSPYRSLSHYAAIGNLRTVALVCRDGSIDWCCFPCLDSPSVFAAILDARRGGRFKVTVEGAGLGDQSYVQDTNVLETRFRAGDGSVKITDFMPLWGDIHGFGDSHAHNHIHRIVKCEKGQAELAVEWSPRFDYARAETRMQRIGSIWVAKGGGKTIALQGVDDSDDCDIADDGFGPVLRASIEVEDGESRLLVTAWDALKTRLGLEHSEELLSLTIGTWRGWAYRDEARHMPEWFGKHFPLLIRSELVLKLMSDASNGAIAAAPTTSLPEVIGGVRNWDYRYVWVRDASMTAQALTSLGHRTDAIEFLHWMENAAESSFREGLGLHVMYRMNGGLDLKETDLTHLEGYRGSRPVRIGNAAADQFQLGIYGELLDTGYELIRRGERLTPEITALLAKVADFVCIVWKEPDLGIWEIRGKPRHFTYSKVMAWMALDRAVLLSETYGLPGDVERWRRSREEIRKTILRKGYSERRGSFVISFDSTDLDAANIRIPLVGFLPAEDFRVQGTIDRTLEELTRNGLVYRYLCDDGLPGREGAFGLCTFWLVDALALSGRLDEAWKIFDRAVELANHAGLFPEQFDPETGEFLGNFPQAYTHIGMINSAIYLAYAEGRIVTETAPAGTWARRAEAHMSKLSETGAKSV